MTGMLIGLSC